MCMIPFPSNVADWFQYRALTTIVAANGTAQSSITTAQDSYFLLTAFRASSSEDGATDVIPNNFSVLITRSSTVQMMGGAVPQRIIASSSYQGANVFSIPIIYAPLTDFRMDFTDLSGNANNAITFVFEGYKIFNLDAFLKFYPAAQLARR